MSKVSAKCRLRNWSFEILMYSAVAAISTGFGYFLFYIISQGVSGLSFNFILSLPERSGRSGGIYSILVSTFAILGGALAFTVPLGLLTAMCLFELESFRGFGYFVRRSLDILCNVPSIVFGLFGNAFFCKFLGLGYSILSGSLTLMCMMLPLFIVCAENGLRILPVDLRKAGLALGISRFTTLFKILLPAASPSLIAGLMLSSGRALAESAALIFTSGYVDRTPESLMDSGRSLAVHIYDLAMNVPGGDENAFKSACVLLVILVMVNAVAHFFLNKTFQRGRYD